MKINFRDERFQQLLSEAQELDVSIPKLIDSILENHYSHKYSHTGVEEIEREIRSGFSVNPEGCTHINKN